MTQVNTAEEAEYAAQYDAAYYEGGGASHYVEYGNDPGWRLLVGCVDQWLPVDPRTLDVGCAHGWLLRAGEKRGWRVDGCDVSEYAVRRAVHPAVVQAFSWRLPYDDATFDLVTSMEMLEHVPQWLVWPTLLEMWRVLKPGGLMVHKIGLDLEGDASWDRYGTDDGEDDGTHLTMQPRWWWERRFARLSTPPERLIEQQLDVTFTERDWWRRWFVRRRPITESSGVEGLNAAWTGW